MRQSFVPKSFTPPQQSQISDEYYVEPINTSHTEEDLRTITNNAETIIKLRGGSRNGWPTIFTYEENFIDLAWLQMCFRMRQLFSYIIRDRENRYIGCIYIYPIELYFAEKEKDYDVDFSFWITKDAYDQEKYELIFSHLIAWLKESWPFDHKRIYFRNKKIPLRLKS